MDLMTLAAKIVLDDSSYKKGISSAEKAGSALANKMNAMTVAVGNIAADMIRKGFSAIQGVINGAIDGYADYQQLIGGVETLFKKSANTVAKYAQQSYKTTGLSANDYMETVTSFSAALISGLKGDTEEAAEMANMAITDMADNANKMGTDISSIQNAYQGFAKQNYTMLDNLKLGYGGTASEMVRLINDSGILEKEIKDLDGITFDQIVAAIHKIQTEMEITGTTAKEAADTISGSKASFEAAWADLLSAVGGEGDMTRMEEVKKNFQESFSTYMSNFIPTLGETIINSGTLVESIAEAIASLPTTLLSELGEDAIESGADMVRSVGKITNWMLDSIINVFKSASLDNTSITDLGSAIGEFLGSGISTIVTNAGAIFDGIVAVGTGLATGLVSGLVDGLTGDDSEVSKITDALNEQLTEVDVSSTQATALISYLQSLAEKYGSAATNTSAWKDAVSQLETILPGSAEVIAGYVEDVNGALADLGSVDDVLTAMVKIKEKYGEGAEQTNAWREAISALDELIPGVDTAIAAATGHIEGYGKDVAGYIDQANMSLDTLLKAKMLTEMLKAIGEQYGEGATETEAWKEAVAALDELLPGAGEKLGQYSSDIQGVIDKLNAMNAELRQTSITNALNNALAGQWELLTEQQLEYQKASNRYEQNQFAKDQYTDSIVQAIQAAAQAQLDQFGDRDQLLPYQMDQYDALQNLVNGLTDSGLQELKDLDLGSLWSALQALGIDEVDGKGLQEFMTLFTDADAQMATAMDSMKALAPEIDATKASIEETTNAMTQTATELLGSGEKAADSVESGGTAVLLALTSLAAKFASFNPGVSKGPGDFGLFGLNFSWFQPRAIGMYDVPRDGFLASLHKDEMVLSKSNADAYRNGGGAGEVVGAIQEMRGDLQNMQMVVGKEVFGRTVVKYGGTRMRGYIGQSENREYSGYGT